MADGEAHMHHVDHGQAANHGSNEDCPVCDGEPRVLLVIAHPTMRRLTRAMLEREFACWIGVEVHMGEALADAVERQHPDLVVLDAGDFPHCCRRTLNLIPPSRMIVIGPEPDESYRSVALGGGAGAWLPRDLVGDQLAAAMRAVLGCVHDPCPPTHPGRASEHESTSGSTGHWACHERSTR